MPREVTGPRCFAGRDFACQLPARNLFSFFFQKGRGACRLPSTKIRPPAHAQTSPERSLSRARHGTWPRWHHGRGDLFQATLQRAHVMARFTGSGRCGYHDALPRPRARQACVCRPPYHSPLMVGTALIHRARSGRPCRTSHAVGEGRASFLFFCRACDPLAEARRGPFAIRFTP